MSRALANHPQYEIINIDKIGYGANPANLEDLEKEKRYAFIKGDVCNSKLVNRIVKQVDAVLNLAAKTHVDRSISNPAAFIPNNTIGSFTVLEAIRKHIKQAQIKREKTKGE